jgi:hypothetical protein
MLKMPGEKDANEQQIAVSCHCHHIRLLVPQKPPSINYCQCSLCRRYGVAWSYYNPAAITFLSPAIAAQRAGDVNAGLQVGGVHEYIWGDKTAAFVSCEECGCMVYWWPLEGGDMMGVNMNCVDDVDSLKNVNRRVTYEEAERVKEGVYTECGPVRD